MKQCPHGQLMKLDCADLGKVGGLQCVISLLSNEHEGLRCRAAELIAVCAQNNPPVQQVSNM